MNSISFTGHRNLTGNIDDLKKRLYSELENAIKEFGTTDFYNGGSVGFDLLAARVVLMLKKEYPQIRLCMVLPCSSEEQSERWNDEQKKEYHDILRSADSIEQTSEHYCDDCMKIRNARLVELADCCFCYYNSSRKRSGTGQTVRMAQKKSITVVNFYIQNGLR